MRDWQDRYARDEVPDAMPYGFDRMVPHGVTPEFAEHNFPRPVNFLARVARRATGGCNVAEGMLSPRDARQHNADVVLCYNERTGIPALLAPQRKAPVITGVAWLAKHEETPPLLRRMADISLPRAARVFTQTQPVYDNLLSQWGVPQDQLELVPFGVDTDFYAVQPPPDIPGVVVSAGTDVLRDHELLVKAVAKVKEEYPAAWLELAAGSGLHPQVPPELGKVHTEQLNGRMRDLYRRSSVVAVAVKPAVAGSGLTVVLEGMASGRPVVVTANPAFKEYVTDGVTGVLVRPNDVDAMAKAILDLLADPARAAEIGRAAALEVRRRFTSGIMAQRFAEIAQAL